MADNRSVATDEERTRFITALRTINMNAVHNGTDPTFHAYRETPGGKIDDPLVKVIIDLPGRSKYKYIGHVQLSSPDRRTDVSIHMYSLHDEFDTRTRNVLLVFKVDSVVDHAHEESIVGMIGPIRKIVDALATQGEIAYFDKYRREAGGSDNPRTRYSRHRGTEVDPDMTLTVSDPDNARHIFLRLLKAAEKAADKL